MKSRRRESLSNPQMVDTKLLGQTNKTDIGFVQLEVMMYQKQTYVLKKKKKKKSAVAERPGSGEIKKDGGR